MQSNKSLLDDTINLSLIELIGDFKVGDHASGWHQFFNSDKVGNVATAQAILLLDIFQLKFANIDKAFSFIASQQKKMGDILNIGGWSYITNFSERANTESTCWALRALQNKEDSHKESIEGGIKWLLSNFKSEGPNRGWGTIKEDSFRVYSTCLALQTLKSYGYGNTVEYQQAIQTLKRIQRIDGGWGPTTEASSTLTHTAHCVLTLIDSGFSVASKEIANGLSWIAKALNNKIVENDFQMGYVERIDINPENGNPQRILFNHMPLPYALLALIKSEKGSKDIIYDSVSKFINGHKNGHWQHPFLPGEMTLWAMYDVLLLFKAFKDSKYFEDFDKYFLTEVNSDPEHFDIIIFTVVPVEFITLNNILNFKTSDQKPDYIIKGNWYYRYTLNRNGKRPLSCLITLIGKAGEVGCSIACNQTFTHFKCDLAVLCGIAAGNRDDVKRFDGVIAESVVAYEYQRLEENKITYRPIILNTNPYVSKLINKLSIFENEFLDLVKMYHEKVSIDTSNIANYSVSETKSKIGTIASGAKLIADGVTLKKLKEEWTLFNSKRK